MQKHQHEDKDVGEMILLVIHAANTLVKELRDARPLIDFQQHNLIDKVSRALETPEFSSRAVEADLELLQAAVTILISHQVLGVETSLHEVYSDYGMIEYEISRTPSFSLKGKRLKGLVDAIMDFRQVQLELEIRRKEERILAQRALH
ncbi:hypothetical protein R3X27_12085 [Tropicimonas sp. TH_r6]|uniref:hypothetical protein n=1 Tax=Tropicimonas sp. TH_r6 TaxID=3082085 RepID=UPI0029539158|nr:hypothetical protein [Tropicimonas sp. TH_r6]MDV7143422.1 hypothetical protein [Tropicimonas sp. TH_r6]